MKYLQIKSCKRIGRRINYPLTVEGTAIAIIGLGAIGGMIGGTIWLNILIPFLK